MTEACPFCEIIAGRAPATVEGQWPDTIAIVPLNPVVPGHILVIPRVHVIDAAHDPIVTASSVARAAQWVQAQGSARHWNILTSIGRAATQTVFHLHWHVVPRLYGDGLALPWSGGGD